MGVHFAVAIDGMTIWSLHDEKPHLHAPSRPPRSAVLPNTDRSCRCGHADGDTHDDADCDAD
jgi:hypothetical protein